MTKPVIVTRATKGSALTWTEGDSNFTNLQNATITVAGDSGTNQAIDLNGTITVSGGTGLSSAMTTDTVTINLDNTAVTAGSYTYASITVDAQGRITAASNGTAGAATLDELTDVVISTPSTGQFLKYNGAQSRWENSSASFLSAVGEDANPTLGGNLTVSGYSIVSASNGNISITPNGTGNIILDGLYWPQADGSANQVLKTDGSGQLSWTTVSAGAATLDELTDVVISTPSTGQILKYNGAQSRWENGTGGIDGLYADTNPSLGGNLTVMGYSIISSSNGNITIAPNGTGKTRVSALNYNEGAIYDLGTTGGTITPDVTNGNVQKITLNSALTFNAFNSPVEGQSLTLIIYGGTSYTSITSTMKFAGGIKTLTGTAGCIDILSVYYDGTNYFASLGKGFA